jgi:hypothetical protein
MLENDGLVLARPGDKLAVELDRAAVRLRQSGDNAQQRRLSATARPEQGDDLTGRRAKIDVLKNLQFGRHKLAAPAGHGGAVRLLDGDDAEPLFGRVRLLRRICRIVCYRCDAHCPFVDN